MKIDKKCDFCKKDFSVRPSRKKTARFCSNDCKNANNKLLTDSKRWNWKPKIKKKCEVCDIFFVVINNRKDTARFCSKSCRAKEQYKNGALKNCEMPSGKNHPNWRGGKYVDSQGYVQICSPRHPNKVKRYVFEHRLVMEKHLGRFLKREELIHHKNEIKTDNRLSNLVLTNRTEHQKLHKKS